MKTATTTLISEVRGALPDVSVEERRVAPRSGSALLITLLMLSLITIIAVAFLGTVTWEVSASRKNYEDERARSLAILGMNTAMAQVRQALGPWDNPYKNFATNPPPYFWSMSPGMITCWTNTSLTPITNYALFSTGSTNLVNLNAAASDGSCPIAGETNPPSAGAPNISVYWANVLKNPANTTASASNPLVGRYAFWVDDENAKININTADGTLKYTTNSLGIGTPSEVSLQVLQQGGANLSSTVATNIVYLARTTGLNSPKEILRAAGTTPDLYTNNTFNVTAYGRSPDLNIFGQPKMALMPIQGADLRAGTDMLTNGITLQPPVEIYPTPSQLPPYYVVNPANNVGGWTWYPSTTASPTAVPWPLAFRGQTGLYQNGNNSIGISPGGGYTQANFYWINGMLLANYLAGVNSANQTIIWPAFPGSSAANFKGKYTPRQIDSIVAQIVSLGAKAISPDRPQDLDGDNNTESPYQGRSTTDPPLLFGWLSHQWVIGMGRSPKVEAMELGFTTYGSMGNTNSGNYTPPQATLNILQEWWMPANYLGGKNTLNNVNFMGMNLGVQCDRAVLNTGDLTSGGDPVVSQPVPIPFFPPAPLPKLPDSSGSTNSYWGNQVLANNQGIDFQANPSTRYDPDTNLASAYHPYTLTNGNYYGGSRPFDSGNGFDFETPLEMNAPQAATPTQLQPSAPNGDWAPGELRVLSSSYGNLIYMDMQSSADNSTLAITGGIQVRSETIGLSLSDMDPTPLESIRGSQARGNSATELYDNENWTGTNQLPGSPGGTIRDRNIASVIPIVCSMPIPGNHPVTSSESGLGDTEYILATVADPLVNKFPGDWNSTTNNSAFLVPLPIPLYWPDIDSADAPHSMTATNSATEFSSGFHSTVSRGSATPKIGPDPDSYWMPQEDVPICYLTNVPSQTLIPRSARFPNIGYLQYIRTGIIPDDETQPYSSQHGTPFRLLNFNMSTNASQTIHGVSYPDWAMLDLLYIPSILYPYRSPYGYYGITGAWQGYGNPVTLAHFSTGGGSTPGRINPNGAVIYTTNTATPTPGIGRTVPLAAVFQGVMVNQTNNVSTSPTAGYSGGTSVDYSLNESDTSSIPVAIERYIRANGPLRMPAELCNVPAIAALSPVNAQGTPINVTRNDLIRQVVGALTTQSNTFSVWVAGQAISKTKSNTNYGVYESGDQITGTVRYHFIVERYLDPGTDGIYGNSIDADAGGDYDAYDSSWDYYANPLFPRYLYRVVSSEEIR